MTKFIKKNNEVYYPSNEFVCITKNDFVELKKLSTQNPRQRVRFCAHQNPEDDIHEMFIVHTKNCYVRPHFHLKKAESLYVIEGQADLIIFNDNGEIIKIIKLSRNINNGFVYYRIEECTIHMLIIKSDYFIFHEVTKGPFKIEHTRFPAWAPKGDLISDNSFINNLQY